MKKLAIVVTVMALAGCGGDVDLDSDKADPINSAVDTAVSLRSVKVDGTTMLCLQRTGERAGFTCDWYGWHLKREGQ